MKTRVSLKHFVSYCGLICHYGVDLMRPHLFKVGLSPSKKIVFICTNDIPSKVMKNAFYFILKALFVLKIYKFLSLLFCHVEKTD